ncbi:hypothetical protein [Geotalea toluenoxydans]|uniref:hypothetical protein n=1 Tax=Geotalea toluenoxydans TaxID=421624 RepID=UPI000A78FEC3|nr:hypothetical protein [Geotalea toluenoxydans]
MKTVYCKFKSNLGTWSPAYSASISLDTTAPTVNIISPTAATQSTTPLLSYAVSEGTVTVKVDGVTVNNVSGDTLYLAAGLHTVLVESCDGAGNKGSSEIQFTVLQPPTVILNSPAAGYTNNNLPLLTYTVSNGTVVVKVDDVVINKVSGDTLGPLVDGTHWVQVVATNAGGSRMAQQLFTVDTVAPTVSITSPTSGTINTSYRLLSYTVSDGTVVVKLDGVTVNKTSGSNLGPFADGPHTVRVEATDAAGNKGFAEVSFTVDVLPTVSISSPASGLNTNNNSPILTYTVSNGTVVVKVDGIVVNKVSGDSLGPLADGTHLVRVEATDTAGTGFSEKSFIVDTVAPDISISSPTTGTTTDNQPLLTFTSNAGGTATVKVDGVVVNKFNGSRLSTLANGPHTVRVEMRDMASNVGVAEVTFTVNALLTIPSEDFETGNLGKLPWVTSGNGLWTAKTTTKHGGIYSAEAPVSIVDSQSASLEVPVNCVAGNLIFWYSVSSEANFDFLTLYVDGVQKGKWSGSVPWTQATVAVTAGTHTFKWVYSKDGSVSTGSDTAWVDDIVFPTVTSGPPPTGNAKNEGFESGNLTYLPWVTSGNGLWAVKTTTKHGGIYAVEAPVSITDNQNAGIEVTQNCAAGNITFWYSVSSEANYDYLRFYIDGIEQSKWSGSIGWNQASFPVIAGSHTFKLTYSKDGSVSSGSDTAWIDDIVIPVP